MVAAAHNWKIVAPWYRPLGPTGSETSHKSSRPVLQMYSGGDFVNRFLEEPQRSLRFGERDIAQTPASTSALRKLFLHTHHRFYLVVCEVRCDAPGFPRVERGQILEAGFVVRRQAAISQEVQNLLLPLYQERAKLQTQRSALGRLRIANQGHPAPQPGRAIAAQSAEAKATAQLGELEAQIQQALTTAGLQNLSWQAWKPSENPAIGEWQDLGSGQAELVGERTYPLYPLIPDPRTKNHSGHGGTLYFGVVPVGDSDVDATGTARFDERHVYHARCFVRKKRTVTDAKGRSHDCPGEVVFSEPTEVYQLASQGDLDGTSNLPVTVQLPDLNALREKATALALGAGAGMRMIAPPGSGLPISVDSDQKASRSGSPESEICFFAIPLITIVAMFVLRLFLPIVVFLFQLWFLLRLKFCIPPQINVDAEVAASIQASGGGIDASLEAEIDLQLKTNLGELGRQLVEGSNPASAEEKAALLLDFYTDFSGSLPPDLRAMVNEGNPADAPPAVPGVLPQVAASLSYYDVRPLPA